MCSAPSNTLSIALVPFPTGETLRSSFPLLGHPSHGLGAGSPTLLSTRLSRIVRDLFLNQSLITGRDRAGGTIGLVPHICQKPPATQADPKSTLHPSRGCKQSQHAAFCSHSPNPRHTWGFNVSETPQVLHRGSTPHQAWGKAITEHRWAEIHHFPKVLTCNSPKDC